MHDSLEKIIVGNNVWIGMSCVPAKGVSLGNTSLLGGILFLIRVLQKKWLLVHLLERYEVCELAVKIRGERRTKIRQKRW